MRRMTGWWALLWLASAPAAAEIVKPVRPPAVPAPVTAPVEAPSTRATTGTRLADESLAEPPGEPAHDAVRPAPPEGAAQAPPAAAPAPQSNIRWPQAVPAPVAAPPSEPADIEGADVPPTLSRVDAFRDALAAYAQADDPQRHERAARLLQVAAEAGDLRAAAAYGYLQALGLGLPRDVARGRRQLEAASAAGLARADYLLSVIERADRRPGAAQREAAYRERAARRGDALAQNAMGVHYQRQGDATTAELWYRRAAEAGSPSARQNLAALAGASAAKPADAGDAPATEAETLYAQARRYHRGDGVAIDYGQALRFYRAAAARGSEAARQMLGLIQSRPARDGAVDPVWMRQLASAPVATASGRPASPQAGTASRAPRLDDPFSGLAALAPGQPASPKAATARRIP